MAYSEREIAEIARFITDRPYTWREDEGRLVIVTRDNEFEVLEADASPAGADDEEEAGDGKSLAKGAGATRKGAKTAPKGPDAVRVSAEMPPLDERELELMSKTALLALAQARGIWANRRWAPVEIRRALLAADGQTSEVEKKTSEVKESG